MTSHMDANDSQTAHGDQSVVAVAVSGNGGE